MLADRLTALHEGAVGAQPADGDDGHHAHRDRERIVDLRPDKDQADGRRRPPQLPDGGGGPAGNRVRPVEQPVKQQEGQ